MINLDRGVMQVLHPMKFRVCMYLDEPGVYYDVNGNYVADSIAKEAGFDVDKYKRERDKQEALRKAREKIERQFAETTKDTEAVLSAEKPEVRHVGAGKYAIYDGESRITGAMTKDQAEEILKARDETQA